MQHRRWKSWSWCSIAKKKIKIKKDALAARCQCHRGELAKSVGAPSFTSDATIILKSYYTVTWDHFDIIRAVLCDLVFAANIYVHLDLRVHVENFTFIPKIYLTNTSVTTLSASLFFFILTFIRHHWQYLFVLKVVSKGGSRGYTIFSCCNRYIIKVYNSRAAVMWASNSLAFARARAPLPFVYLLDFWKSIKLSKTLLMPHNFVSVDHTPLLSWCCYLTVASVNALDSFAQSSESHVKLAFSNSLAHEGSWRDRDENRFSSHFA